MRKNKILVTLFFWALAFASYAQKIETECLDTTGKINESFQIVYYINDIEQPGDVYFYFYDSTSKVVYTPKAYLCDTCSRKKYCYADIPVGTYMIFNIDSIQIKFSIDYIDVKPPIVKLGVITDLNLLEKRYNKKDIRRLKRSECRGVARAARYMYYTPMKKDEIILFGSMENVKSIYYLIFPSYGSRGASFSIFPVWSNKKTK